MIDFGDNEDGLGDDNLREAGGNNTSTPSPSTAALASAPATTTLYLIKIISKAAVETILYREPLASTNCMAVKTTTF